MISDWSLFSFAYLKKKIITFVKVFKSIIFNGAEMHKIAAGIALNKTKAFIFAKLFNSTTLFIDLFSYFLYGFYGRQWHSVKPQQVQF